MSDREKVIKGLEWILNDIEENGHYQVGYYADEIREAIDLLKKQESEWLEDSDPGQEYGTTWACRKCGHSIHEPFIWNPYDSGYKYCLHCGRKMKLNLKEEN